MPMPKNRENAKAYTVRNRWHTLSSRQPLHTKKVQKISILKISRLRCLSAAQGPWCFFKHSTTMLKSFARAFGA